MYLTKINKHNQYIVNLLRIFTRESDVMQETLRELAISDVFKTEIINLNS